MKSETKTTVTLFATGLFAIAMVFGANLTLLDFLKYFH